MINADFVTNFLNHRILGTLVHGAFNYTQPVENTSPLIMDGTTISGYFNVVYIPKIENQTYEAALRGVHTFGCDSVIYDHKLQEEKDKNIEGNDPPNRDDDGNETDKNIGILQQGVLSAGMRSFVNIRFSQDGVMLLGAYSVCRAYNDGVIIQGIANNLSANAKRETGTFHEHINAVCEHKDHVEGSGIYIRGLRRVMTFAGSGNEQGNSIRTEPSLIQTSTNSNMKTKLSGYLQLDEKCNIFDKTGKQIVQNGVIVKS